MRNSIRKYINGKTVLLMFVLCNIIYAAMLIITIPEVMHYSRDIKILDMMPAGYDVQYVETLFKTLGTAGRDAYLYHQLPLDLLYPGLFGTSSFLVLAYFLNKLGKLESALFYLCLIPMFAAIFDYAENIGIINMLKDYPTISEMQVLIASIFTVTKSILTSIYFIILIIVLLEIAKKKVFSSKI